MQQPRKKTPTGKKTYINPVNESGYKINPIVLETKKQMEAEYIKQMQRRQTFVVDTNPLGISYYGFGQLNRAPKKLVQTTQILESRNDQGKDRNHAEYRKTSTGESSNDLLLRQTSSTAFVRQRPEEKIQDEVHDLLRLRARLRRTGQIEEGSGLHRIELARKHSQRIIDVQ